MNKQIILDPFNNVVANGTAICDMNKFLGSVLEKITFSLGGTLTKAMITGIAIKANGKIIYETTGAFLESSNAYGQFANAVAATYLKIDFMDRRARTTNAFQAGALDLSRESGITSLRLEVTIAGATSPSMIGFADVSPPTADPAEAGLRWLMARRHRATVSIGAAGTFALPIPHIDPSGGGSNYRRIYIYSSTMTAFKTMREGVTEHEMLTNQNGQAQLDNGKIPQANLVVFDPCQDGQLSGRTWDTRPGSGVRSAQFYATFSGAETITIETDELIPFGAY